MKIALSISGQPRYIKECYNSIYENILNPLSPDIYAHLWWDDSYINKKFKFHALDEYKENMMDVFIKTFKCKKYKFEPQVEFDLSGFNFINGEMSRMIGNYKEMWSREVLFKQFSMWYSVMKSAELIEENYDLYIRIRTDLVYNKKINLNNIDFDDLIIDDFENKSQICDWFCIGKKDNFLKYCNTFNLINKISNKNVVTSTRILKESLKLQNVNYKILPIGVDIFRKYEIPFNMNNYSDADYENKPYWFK